MIDSMLSVAANFGTEQLDVSDAYYWNFEAADGVTINVERGEMRRRITVISVL